MLHLPTKPATSLSVMYVIVEPEETSFRGTVYHLQNESEIALLRCLTNMTMLPTDTMALENKQPRFMAAMLRYISPPRFRKALAHLRPEEPLLSAMLGAPLLVFFLESTPSPWLLDLASKRVFGVLTSSETIANHLNHPNLRVGLLKGFDDYVESYRVLSELLASLASSTTLLESELLHVKDLVNRDLFQDRPRLSFLPSLPWPAPHEGRPATLLFNRLSNNADQPALRGDSDPRGTYQAPAILDMSIRVCAAMTFIENGLEPPAMNVPVHELQAAYTLLTSDRPEDEKQESWFSIGRQLSKDKHIEGRLLIAVPAARTDLIKKIPPPTFRPDASHSEGVAEKVRVVSDHLRGDVRTEFKNSQERYYYESAKMTLIQSHRLIATQTALLASATHTTPVQVPEIGPELYSLVNNLNVVLETGSKKVTTVFRGIEEKLRDALPDSVMQDLVGGTSSITFYSDLPFEWTLLDNFPICLHRPVSRMPMALGNWSMMSNALERETSIDIQYPERVLVLDMIANQDPIRRYSDNFQTVANNIGQRYSYSSPCNMKELQQVLESVRPDIVVLDAHGRYDKKLDRMAIGVQGGMVWIEDFLPRVLVPPVWILSACDTAVTGSIKGTLVAELLQRGAICVVATLNKVDALAASVFVGRFLTDIYSPPAGAQYDDLGHAFFVSQLTTALLYDPLYPLIKKSERDLKIKEPLAKVMVGYLRDVVGRQLDLKTFAYEAAVLLGKHIHAQGLDTVYSQMVESRLATPQTLLFTAFGFPANVKLRQGNKRK